MLSKETTDQVDDCRIALDKAAREDYANSTNGLGASSCGLDGIPFVRRNAIAIFCTNYSNEQVAVWKEKSEGAKLALETVLPYLKAVGTNGNHHVPMVEKALEQFK